VVNLKEIFDYYNERAPEYDDIYLGKQPGLPEPEFYSKDVERIKEVCAGFGNGHLIDIGCGTGYWLPYYAGNCSEITLVDQSRRMLFECQKRVKASTVDKNIHYVKGDFFDVRFFSRIFDSALIAFLISHLVEDDAKVFFVKLRKILKSHAKVLWIDGFWSELRSRYREKSGFQQRALADGRSFTIFKKYFDEHDIQSVIRGNGMALDSIYTGDIFFAAKATLSI
jgi:SAM-dependent methyltransferase